MNRLVGDRAILDVMSSERDAIEYEAKKDIQNRLNQYSLGVSITQVKMQQVIPPKGEVQDAFEDVNKAIQDRNRLINEGEQAYYAEIPKIEGQAKQMIAEAEGYKQSRINKAKGEVALFNAIYEQYKKAPEVTRQRLYYETLNAVLKDNKNTEIVGKDVNNFLPLKNIGGGAGE
jgi:membrane protease subunit HflK